MKTNNENHVGLESNVPFEDLPDWFKNAKTKQAVIRLIGKRLFFEKGTWQGGIWQGGIWQNGTWKNGIWQRGMWQDGIWRNGTWQGGIWQDGIWEKGYWEDGIWEKGFKTIGQCKWRVFYSNSGEIRIGCKTKTIKKWDKWFKSDKVYETERNTTQFKQIETAYKLAKYAIQTENE